MITAWLAALLQTATPSPAQPVSSPPVIATLVKDGVLDTRDLSWLHGALPAAPAEQKSWAETDAWLKGCAIPATQIVRTDLVQAGVTPTALPSATYGDAVCGQARSLARSARQYRNWTDFSAAIDEARRRLDILAFGAHLGFEATPFDPAWVKDNAQAMRLLRATVMDQVYRNAFDWRDRKAEPTVSDAVWPALEGLINVATLKTDHQNTAMLKAMVTETGWPLKSVVGQRASNSAWLLVQHADDDPAFQLRALRLMEPLVAKNEVSKSNYAYLYDRIMLKLIGTQRYATQMTCTDGTRKPLPLDGSGEIDALRAAVGLGTIADYLSFMNERFSACPK